MSATVLWTETSFAFLDLDIDSHPADDDGVFKLLLRGLLSLAPTAAHTPLTNRDNLVFNASQSPFDQGFEAGHAIFVLLNAECGSRYHKLAKRHSGPLAIGVTTGRSDPFRCLCAYLRSRLRFSKFSDWWLGEADDQKWEPSVMFHRLERVESS